MGTKQHLYTYTPLRHLLHLLCRVNLSNSNMDQTKQSQPEPNPKPKPDFLIHLELYLSKRDGVDKLLKISRYASKIILASSLLQPQNPFTDNLKSFESSVGLSRKAFRLGKFVQDLNSLRFCKFESRNDLVLAVLAYGGEGVYYFIEQFVWLAKSGLIHKKYLGDLQKFSAWFEFVGYIGSVSMKVRDLRRLEVDEEGLVLSVEVEGGEEEVEKLRKVREKKLMKRLSIVQDLADGFMALADISEGKLKLSTPLVVSLAGLLSAVISTHKNWVSC